MWKRYLVIIVALIIIAGLYWWLFGWTSADNPSLGMFCYKRFFGRVTIVDLDSNRDGKPDARVKYTWNDPYKGIVDGICVLAGVPVLEDRDFDGRWDTWTVNLGPDDDGNCIYEFKVDTSGDGKPDWRFTSVDSVKAYQDIRDRRGF